MSLVTKVQVADTGLGIGLVLRRFRCYSMLVAGGLVVYRYSCYSMLIVGWCCAGATVAVHRCRMPHSGERRVLAFYIGMRGIITK